MSKKTDSREEDRLLKIDEEHLSLVLYATEDGVWDWNIITNEKFFSPRWCEIMGYEYDDPDFLHNFDSWKLRIHPDDVSRVMLAFDTHLNDKTLYDVEYRHQH